MKVNFNELNVEISFGEFQKIDISKELANYIHANTSDIGVDDTARAIYYNEDGYIDIPSEHASIIIDIIKRNNCGFVAAIKKAVIKELTSE
jgi:hypothetical protein